ncbi:protein draper-like [Saccostrea echinata]|uniref:protein draper-like n=1 Tax=Saccostrea echinata TaxID=191078 RepID=UPI002A7FC492|nr:protein draper-like [Saccostrea echinata]
MVGDMDSCGSCLRYKQCHHINGSCPEDCDAGFEGTFCDRECSGGKFEMNCERDCDEHCADPFNCNRKIGECEGGCQPGWKGLQCTNGNVILLGKDNLALNRPTWQSNQYNPDDNLFDSSNAVDGLKTDLSAWGGQCSISSDGYSTSTWWVILDAIYSIHDIRIYYRTDNNAWDASNGFTARFLGFYVYISNSTNRLDGRLCFHDTNYTRSTIPAVANIRCPVHGQYVIYFNERFPGVSYPIGYSKFAYNELCEVEVYGCRTGYYGSNCSLLCPDNCRYCHVETGVCSWCKPGYQGYQCDNVRTTFVSGVNRKTAKFYTIPEHKEDAHSTFDHRRSPA